MKARRVDPYATAAAKRAAAELVAGWPVEALIAPTAAGRLVTSWGLDSADARTIVAGERSRRRV